MTNFVYSEKLPLESKQFLSSIESKLKLITSHWCNEVVFDYCATTENYNDHTLAYIVADFQYFHATVYICPPFHTATDQKKEECLVHELCHLPMAPATDWMRQAIRETIPENLLLQRFLSEITRNTELATQSLTIIIQRLLNQPQSIYYESHVTVEPVFGERLEDFKQIASFHGFKVAKLLMEKDGDLIVSQRDSFCTGHSKHYLDIHNRMTSLCNELESKNFILKRYKVEAVVFDKRL